jgi:hypothetical protein
MGYDSPVEVCSRGTVILDHGHFQDVLHVPNISVNLISIYQITHSSLGKKVEVTLYSIIISDLSYG